MKMKNLLFRSLIVALALGWSASVQLMAQTLKHSFDFEEVVVVDGQNYVEDSQSGVRGLLVDNATITDGNLDLDGGHVSFPANSFDIAQYQDAVTVELFFRQKPGANAPNSYTTIFSFGRTVDGWKGQDYFQFQPSREDGISRLAISTNTVDEPWVHESAVAGEMYTDSRTHYMVAILTDTEIKLYMDGEFAGSTPLSEANRRESISPDRAFLGWTPYSNDPKWRGFIEEYHIYEGEMSAETIGERFLNYMGEDYFNSNLASITASEGTWDAEFDPMVDTYELTVPFAANSVSLEVNPEVDFARVRLYNGGTGALLPAGPVALEEEGETYVDVEITAPDGLTQSLYYVTIVRAEGSTSANLANIELSAGNLQPAFDTHVTEYSIMLPSGTTTLDVSGTPLWEAASVTNVTGHVVNPEGGTVELTTVSEDGEATMVYTINYGMAKFAVGTEFFIHHEPSGFVMSEGYDEEADEVKIYIQRPEYNNPDLLFRFEESGVEGEYFIRNGNDKYLHLAHNSGWNIFLSDGAPEELALDLDSLRFRVVEFETNRVHLISVGKEKFASNVNNKFLGTNNNDLGGGIYSDKPSNNAYIVWNLFEPLELVDPYDTRLESLEIGDLKLLPAFDAYVNEYYVVIDEDATSAEIVAVAKDATAEISGAGVVNFEGDSGSFTVTVTASEDNQYSTSYVINFIREQPFALRHSYTFADGTARDVVGEAHGTIMGGAVVDGEYIASEEGDYIALDAETIAINTYPAFTLELYFRGDGTNGNNNTMMAYLGDTQGNYGVNYVFMNHKSVLAMSTNNLTSPWSVEDGLSTEPYDDNVPNHFVAVVDNEEMSFYVNGALIGTQPLRDGNKVFAMSNAAAYLAKGGYTGDVTWKGGIYEYNIYIGRMSSEEILQRSTNIPVEDGSADASLIDLAVDGLTIDGFSPYVYDYTILLQAGSDEPYVTAEALKDLAVVSVAQAEELPGQAVVTAVAEDGVSTLVYTINFDFVTSIAKPVESARVAVFPTVTSGSFNLVANGAIGSYTVYDLSGRVVLTQPLNGADLSFDLPAAGMYILRVETAAGVQLTKIVKK